MYQALSEQLVALTEVYSQLLQLAREKQTVLQKNNDLAAVRSFTEREEALMARAGEIERLRMETAERIATSLGLTQELTVTSLIEKAEQPTKQALLIAAQELIEVLRQLQVQNSINRQLLELNLSFAAFVLDTAAREDRLGDIYGASGAPAEQAESGYRFFDSEI